MLSYTVNSAVGSSKRVIFVDFFSSFLGTTEVSTKIEYFLKVWTRAVDINGDDIPDIIGQGLDSLVLNGAKRRKTNSAVPYADITEMIDDYLYDMINGHTADLYSSGVSAQAAMDLT